MTFNLPQVSDALATLELPVSGKSITMRPMNVKDLKSLAIASRKKEDPIGMYKTAITILNNSIAEDIKMEKLASADLERAFIKLKSISAGEIETYNIKCPACSKLNDIEINFDEDPIVEITQVEDTRIVLLNTPNGDVGVNMKPFTYEVLLQNRGITKMDEIDQQFEVIKGCVESIFNDDKKNSEVIPKENIPPKDFEEWFNGLNVRQLSLISKYMDSLPTIKIVVDSECKHCTAKISEEIKGLSSFLA